MSDAGASPVGRDRPADEGATGPPLAVLLLALLTVVLGAALMPLDAMAGHVAGYVAAPVLTILLVGVYRRADLARRLEAGYRARPGAGRLATVVLVAAFGVAAVHVWAIATELAS
jgi:hypothetical protein